jgi:hypothetical protein
MRFSDRVRGIDAPREMLSSLARAAGRLLALLDGDSVGDFEDATPRLIIRGSTARPPA